MSSPQLICVLPNKTPNPAQAFLQVISAFSVSDQGFPSSSTLLCDADDPVPMSVRSLLVKVS